MLTFAHTLPANPPGEPPLTVEQVWRGLVRKAEDATRFVPAITACKVVERFAGGLVREAVHAGHTVRERVTFDPPREVAFDDLGPAGGRVLNTLADGSAGLTLTFRFEVPPERAAEVEGSYREAVASTLRAVRELAARGEL